MTGREIAETGLVAAGAALSLAAAFLMPSEPSMCGPVGGLAARCEAALTGVIDGIPFGDPRSGALIKALIAGDRAGVSPQMRAAFRDSGASHLLALSGLHLGILYAILSKILSVLGNSPAARWIRGGTIVLAAFFYVMMTGASPSIVRAFLFILIATLASCLGRRMSLTRILFTALGIQLLASPRSILMPGFQLSYMAVLGIAILFRPLCSLYPSSGKRRGPVGRLWEMMALSISCQLFTAPVAWLRFHTFPKYFLLTNLLAMPCTGVLMCVSLATVTLSAAGICPAWLVSADNHLCRLMLFILETISSM